MNADRRAQDIDISTFHVHAISRFYHLVDNSILSLRSLPCQDLHSCMSTDFFIHLFLTSFFSNFCQPQAQIAMEHPDSAPSPSHLPLYLRRLIEGYRSEDYAGTDQTDCWACGLRPSTQKQRSRWSSHSLCTLSNCFHNSVYSHSFIRNVSLHPFLLAFRAVLVHHRQIRQSCSLSFDGLCQDLWLHPALKWWWPLTWAVSSTWCQEKVSILIEQLSTAQSKQKSIFDALMQPNVVVMKSSLLWKIFAYLQATTQPHNGAVLSCLIESSFSTPLHSTLTKAILFNLPWIRQLWKWHIAPSSLYLPLSEQEKS